MYNFVVLNGDDGGSVGVFNCYLRAINEGLAQLMDDCFPDPPINPGGQCGKEIAGAA